MQARWLAQPSISTRHSWQTPMPQKMPRGCSLWVSRSSRMPAAVRAAARVSPRPALDDPALEIDSDPLAVLNQFPAMSPQRRVSPSLR